MPVRELSAVVIRIVEATVAHGCESQFATLARRTHEQYASTPGLGTLSVGWSLEDEVTRFIWVAIWDSMDDLERSVGNVAKAPAFVRDAQSWVESWNIRHFETFDAGDAPAGS
jgi:hypothetical protein